MLLLGKGGEISRYALY